MKPNESLSLAKHYLHDAIFQLKEQSREHYFGKRFKQWAETEIAIERAQVALRQLLAPTTEGPVLPVLSSARIHGRSRRPA